MKIAWEPQPRQIEALVRKENEILYGGARGGGKTDAGQAWLLYHKDNSKYRALVIRRNADDLKDWTDRARTFFAPTGAIVMGAPAEVRFPSGAIIRTGHLKDENAYSKYQGHEYQNILIEELTHIARESDYEKLLGSCRSTVKGIEPQIFCTTNPDGAGHKWVKNRWKIPNEPTDIIVTVDGERKRVFIPARIEDNPKLMDADPDYVKYLDSIKDEDLRKAWRSGSWSGVNIQGAIYAEQIKQARDSGRIGNVPYESGLLVSTVWDLGIGDSMSIGFFQTFGMEERMIDYYENSGEGIEHYIKVLQDKKYVYGKHYAPHDIMVRELGTGTSRFETAKRLGITFETRIVNITKNGITTTKVKSALPSISIQEGIDQAKLLWEKIWIDAIRCEKFLEASSQYRREFNEKMGELSREPLHDWTSHAADMFRYRAIVPKPQQQVINNSYIPKAERF